MIRLKYYVVIIIWSISAQSVNILLLKGTHDILPDKHYAPCWGLPFIEEKIAEQWYRLAPEYQIQDLESLQPTSEQEADKKLILSIMSKYKGNTATETLLMHLFHIAGGTFNVTNAINNPVRQITSEHMGKILRIIHDGQLALTDSDKMNEYKAARIIKLQQLQQQNLSIKNEIKQINSELSKLKAAKGIDQQSKEKKQSLQVQLEAKNQEVKKLELQIKKNLEIVSSDIDKDFVYKNMQQDLMELLMSFDIKNGTKLFQEKDWKPFLSAILGALQESGSDAVYPENTVQEILLGYMLAKTNTRQDLQKYFEGFLGHPVTLPNEQYNIEEITNILEHEDTDLKDLQKFSDFMCAKIYQEKYMSDMPKIATPGVVKYRGIQTSGCVESVILNLCNIMTYQKKNLKLGNIPEGFTLSRALSKFYQNAAHASPAEVNNHAVHQAWFDVADGMVGVIYNRLCVAGSQDYIQSRWQCDGVIPVDQDDDSLPSVSVIINDKIYTVREKKVGSKIYWEVPRSNTELYCSEMMPSFSNIIVTMNNLFNLNLYQSVDEILKPDFIQKYFKTMCLKLGWSIDDDIMQKILSGNSNELEVPISISGDRSFSIKFFMARGKEHGEVVVSSQNLGSDQEVDQLITADPIIKSVSLSLGLMNFLEHVNQLSPNFVTFQRALELQDCLNLTAMLQLKPLHMDDKYLAKVIIKLGHVGVVEVQKYIIEDIMAKEGWSDTILDAVMVMLYTAYIKYGPIFRLSNTEFFLKYGDRYSISQDIVIGWIQEGLQSSDENIFNEAIERAAYALNHSLIHSDEARKKLEDLLSGKMSKGSLLERLSSEDLMKKVPVGLLLNWIQEGLDSSDDEVQTLSMKKLLNILYDPTLHAHVEQIWNLILYGMNSANSSVKIYVYSCLDVIINKWIFDQQDVAQIFSWIDQGFKISFLKNYSISIIEKIIDKGLHQGILDTQDQVQELLDTLNRYESIIPAEKFSELENKLANLLNEFTMAHHAEKKEGIEHLVVHMENQDLLRLQEEKDREHQEVLEQQHAQEEKLLTAHHEDLHIVTHVL